MLYTGWGPIVFLVFIVITFGAQSLLGDGRAREDTFFTTRSSGC
jgi:hypothetical protein